MLTIGERIKKYRNEKGLTQEELSKILLVSRSAISNWEIGRNYPDLDSIVLLSDIFEISLDELLKEDNTMVTKISKEQKRGKLNKKLVVYLLGVIVFLLLTIGFILYQTTDFNQYISTKIVSNVELTEENAYKWKQVRFNQKGDSKGYLEYNSILNVDKMNYPSNDLKEREATIRITQVDNNEIIGMYDITSKGEKSFIQISGLKRNTEYLVEILGEKGPYNIWFTS